MAALDLLGMRFGRLFILKRSENDCRGKAMWECACDCGAKITTRGDRLREGRVLSCGCLQRERTAYCNTKHGLTSRANKHPLYTTFNCMKSRCNLPTNDEYQRYGGRGIKVCDRWEFGEYGATGFECFVADMGPRPGGKYSIDRRDNDGPYAPWNCRWATDFEQRMNRSNTRFVMFNGSRITLVDACASSGLSRDLVSYRIDELGWSVERALTTPKLVKNAETSQ